MARMIRKAEERDSRFVSDLMDTALAPYYDGDHRAHADRIFRAHIKGGEDNVGHFSKQQVMFILEEDGTQLGMINIVGKRQGTWKISPLIITSAHQGMAGCGSELLSFAENFAREQGARQMYCTVAEQNRSAMGFFRRKGYIPAGHSESHYKSGVTETMLYKLFYSTERVEDIDQLSISVIPFEEKYRDAVTQLILKSDLPTHFNGVDQSWVDALFAGYQRRVTGEVNEKYKLIYVAIDRNDTVLGVAGVTPKKGEPIKIMPCVASCSMAFSALITDLPQHLRTYGHKLYVHLVPGVEETIVLQRLGWSLDAIMPGAYHEKFCTQQWGKSLKESDMRMMRVKGRFFRYIMSRRKRLEVRVGYPNIRNIKPNERIQLESGTESGVIRVRAVRTYSSFQSMLEVESAEDIVPGENGVSVLALLRGIYSTEKEALGVIVLEIEPIN